MAALLTAGCRKNPIERLTNPVPGGAVPQSSGVFVLYDNELKTGGGLELFPTGDNQGIDLSNHDRPVNAGTQIRYVWNGQPVGGQQAFAGFSLIITPDDSTLSSTPAKNFSAAGYTEISMRIRGNLSFGNTLKIEGPSDGTSTAAQPPVPPALTNEWQPFSFSIPSGDFAHVKIFATFSIQYSQPPRTTAPGEGGVIYIDDLRYEKK
jgi:hypothetical protein